MAFLGGACILLDFSAVSTVIAVRVFQRDEI
jgi:hypothetical protein